MKLGAALSIPRLDPVAPYRGRIDGPSAERLKSLLTYNPESGEFHWIEMPRGHTCKGGRADTKSRNYRVINIDGRGWRAHRLAILYMTGAMPILDIDHIDGDSQNNAYLNLREVTAAENMRNRQLHKSNISGVHGVHPTKSSKWRASINGARIGEFDDIDAAIAARRHAEVGAGFHPNHGRPYRDPKKNFPKNVTLLDLNIPSNWEFAGVTPTAIPATSQSWYEISVWPARWYATVFGSPLAIGKNEFRILALLVSAQGLPVSREAIWEHLYGTPFDPSSRVVDMQVSRLRRNLSASNTLLKSSKEIGYRLESKSALLASIIAGNRFRQIEPRSFVVAK